MWLNSKWVTKVVILLLLILEGNGEHDLHVLHVNDFHARFEQTNKYSSTCKEDDAANGDCYGGVARLYQAVKDFREKDPNILLLNAGDMYQGTVWYAKFKYRVVIPFMNLLNFTASALGNHEFDDGPKGLLPLAQNATFPLLCANCDFSSSPEFDGLVKPYLVQEVGGRKVGIIGYLTTETKSVADAGKVKLKDELTSVKETSEKLKSKGVNIIIALGHVGYDLDKRIAAKCPEVDLVIGGHSHSFLYSGKQLPSIEKPAGHYPTMVKQSSGKKVPVVQAYAYSKYLGSIKMCFDESGNMINITGKPLLLDKTYHQNKFILDEMKPWKEKLSESLGDVIGVTNVLLDTSRRMESTLGDLICDAVMSWYNKHWKFDNAELNPKYKIVIHNSGGVRVDLDVGNITMADLLNVLPFQETFDNFVIDANTMKKALEVPAFYLKSDGNGGSGSFLQVSNMRYTIDLNREPGRRIEKVEYYDSQANKFVEVPDNEDIFVITNNYIGKGKDGFDLFPPAARQYQQGPLDTDVVKAYIEEMSPINIKKDNRITFLPFSSSSGTMEKGSVLLATVFCIYSILIG